MPPILAILLGTAIILGVIIITTLTTRSCFRRTPAGPNTDLEKSGPTGEGDFTSYGNLHIPPDRQPTRVALDLMNRILLAPGLPGHTIVLPCPPARVYGAGSAMIHKSQCMPGTETSAPGFDTPGVGRAGQKTGGSVDMGRWDDVDLGNEIFAVGEDEEEDQRGDEELIMDPMSFAFGSGRAMTGLYR